MSRTAMQSQPRKPVPMVRITAEDFALVKETSRNGFYSQQQVISFLVELWKSASPAERLQAMETVAERGAVRA